MKPSRAVLTALLTLCAALAVRRYAYEPIYIASGSMLPTLYVGERLIEDKAVLRFREPRRGEIIVFRAPAGSEHDSVKRVIAVAGDAVTISRKEVYVNGVKLSEPYTQHTRPDERLEGDDLGPLTVPEGCLFVLGDNRDDSLDSSTWRDPATGAPIYFLPLSAVEGLARGFY